MEQSSFMSLVRGLFAFLDSIIYGLIDNAYNLVLEIANYKIFDNVNFIFDKLYMMLAIFMLFKLTFSFVNYLVNPDSFTDKEKGIQKIIFNIVFVFIMLISCPWVFTKLWNLQSLLLKEDVVGNFVFSDSERTLLEYKWLDDCAEYSLANSNGDYIALMILRGFYKPYTFDEIGYSLSTNHQEEYEKFHDDICEYVYNGRTYYYLTAQYYNKTIDLDGVSLPLLDNDIDIYLLDYKWGISTAVGVVVLLILVSFAMDVGLRVVKLSFLEIIAPIPIISYVDPSSGKNGMFKKWLKEVGSTWVSVFIRLFALLFSVRIIQEVGNLKWIGEGENEASTWVTIFVIIGSLMFAKQLPKLIQNITGINLDGGFNINPLKKISDQALGGKAVLGLGAAGVAAGMSGAANLGHRLLDKNTWAMRNKDGKLTAKSIAGGLARGIGKTGSSAIAGAASGGYRTFNKVSKDGKIAAGIKAGHLESMFAKQQREDLERRGSTLGGRVKADANRWVGRLNEAQQNILDFDEEDKKIKKWESSLKNRKEEASIGFKEYSDILSNMNNKINGQKNVKEAQDAIDALKQTGRYFDAQGNKTAEADALDQKLIQEKAKAYNDRKNDADMTAWQTRLRELVTTNENLAMYSPTGLNVDGTINIKAMYDAKAALSAVETRFAREENQLSEAKENLQREKESYAVKAAEADNASRKINGPQPEGWNPSTNINAGTTTGYGPNEYYADRGHHGSGGHGPTH